VSLVGGSFNQTESVAFAHLAIPGCDVRVRALFIAALLWAVPSGAGVKVPADVGFGPAGSWFYGPLLENRGAVPHFGLMINVHAVIDQAWVEENRGSIPPKYQKMADGISEVRIGPSIFIPSTLYISPKLDALGGVGMYGVTWTPIGLTLISTGQRSARDWNKSRGRFSLDAHLLLTYLFIHSDLAGIPTTHFLRPGLELKATIQLSATERFLISFGGGAQVYVPQALGSFGWNPIGQSIWLSWFAFLKFHVRFPYEVNL
jgi:hypothetical protein